MTEQEYNSLSSRIIKCSIEVHKNLGPGLLESVYEVCLEKELILEGIKVKWQVLLPVFYKREKLNKDFMIDMIVEDEIIIELKSLEFVLPIHEAQLVTYLKLANKKLGLLNNFNVQKLTDGIKRKVNGFFND